VPNSSISQFLRFSDIHIRRITYRCEGVRRQDVVFPRGLAQPRRPHSSPASTLRHAVATAPGPAPLGLRLPGRLSKWTRHSSARCGRSSGVIRITARRRIIQVQWQRKGQALRAKTQAGAIERRRSICRCSTRGLVRAGLRELRCNQLGNHGWCRVPKQTSALPPVGIVEPRVQPIDRLGVPDPRFNRSSRPSRRALSHRRRDGRDGRWSVG
jgi:hypothetical protein